MGLLGEPVEDELHSANLPFKQLNAPSRGARSQLGREDGVANDKGCDQKKTVTHCVLLLSFMKTWRRLYIAGTGVDIFLWRVAGLANIGIEWRYAWYRGGDKLWLSMQLRQA